MPSNNIVYALDIGVYYVGKNGKILSRSTAAWCRIDQGISDFSTIHTHALFGKSIPNLAERIAADLQGGAHVSLGFEAPMWLPLEHEHKPQLRLFDSRFKDEKGSEWFLQAGAAATLKSIALGVMLRKYLTAESKDFSRTTNPKSCKPNQLSLFEAFVVGEFKHTKNRPKDLIESDEWDAFLACLAWGALNCDFQIPPSVKPNALHKAGTRQGHCLSVWDLIFSDSGIASEGPLDCEVVALRQNQ